MCQNCDQLRLALLESELVRDAANRLLADAQHETTQARIEARAWEQAFYDQHTTVRARLKTAYVGGQRDALNERGRS